MMKLFGITFYVLLSITITNAFSQELTGTKWIKVKKERKDGSRIVYRGNADESKFKLIYDFINSNEVIIQNQFLNTKSDYRIEDGKLSLGSYQTLVLEYLSDTLMIIVEQPFHNVTEDKYDRIYMIKEKDYLKYIMDQNLVQFENDTTIISNEYVMPNYSKGNLDSYLMSQIHSSFSKSYLIGSFYLYLEGKLFDIEISKNEKVNNKLKTEFIEALESTVGDWKTPSIPSVSSYKTDFSVRFLQKGPMKNIIVNLGSTEAPCFDCGGLTLDELDIIDSSFKKGNALLSTEKFDKAILQYNKCIKLDSTFFDAFYNRAYSYIQLNQLNNACEDWKFLLQQGQKEGERMFLENCK